jgi:hypothetical protein
VLEVAAVDDVEGLQAREGGTPAHRKCEPEAWAAAQVQVFQTFQMTRRSASSAFTPHTASQQQI